MLVVAYRIIFALVFASGRRSSRSIFRVENYKKTKEEVDAEEKDEGNGLRKSLSGPARGLEVANLVQNDRQWCSSKKCIFQLIC